MMNWASGLPFRAAVRRLSGPIASDRASWGGRALAGLPLSSRGAGQEAARIAFLGRASDFVDRGSAAAAGPGLAVVAGLPCTAGATMPWVTGGAWPVDRPKVVN